MCIACCYSITIGFTLLYVCVCVTQRGNTDALKQELDEQKRRNAQLEEDLKRARHQPEKPYEQQAKDGRLTVSIA